MRARPLTRRDASLAQLSLAESTEERDRFRLDKKGLEDQLAQLKLQAGFHAFVPDSVWRSQLLPALPLACAQLAHLRAAVDDNEVERDHLKQVGRPRNTQRRAPPTPDVATASRAMQEIATIKEECDALKAKGTPKGRLSSMGLGGRF